MMSSWVRHGDLTIHADYLERLKSHSLDQLDAFMKVQGTTSLDKKGLAQWRERIVLDLGQTDQSTRFYLKRYNNPPLRQQLSRWWAGYRSTAEAEWRWIHELESLDIGVPQVVAYGFRRCGFRETCSAILTEELTGQSLERWAKTFSAYEELSRLVRQRIIESLAQLVSKLHSAGLVHRDLYLSHIFVDGLQDRSPRLFLLDLQRVLQPRRRFRRWVIKDLAALNYSTPAFVASRTDRWRFLRQYGRHLGLPDNLRNLARAVSVKTRRIARHSRKHGLG